MTQTEATQRYYEAMHVAMARYGISDANQLLDVVVQHWTTLEKLPLEGAFEVAALLARANMPDSPRTTLH